MKKIEWTKARIWSKDFRGFLWQRHKPAVVIFILALTLFFSSFAIFPQWWDKTDKLGFWLAVINTLAIVLLWFVNVTRQWRESLPLYEIAVLEDEQGVPLMMVALVPLVSEGDSRAQAQAALNVWNDADKLPFKQWVNRKVNLGEWLDRSGVFNAGKPARLVLMVIRKTADQGKAQWKPIHPVQLGRTNVYLAESHALKGLFNKPAPLPHAEVKRWYEAPQPLKLESDNGTPQQL